MPFSLETAATYWDKIRQYPVIPMENPLDTLLGGGLRKGLIHGIGSTKAVMASLDHQLLLQYHLTISRDQWKPVMLVEGINSFNPYRLSKMAVSHLISPSVLLDNIQVVRAFQWYQMIELVEERVPEWIDGNPSAVPGMILVVGITTDFEEMVVNHTDDPRTKDQQKMGVNLKPFRDLKRALGAFSKVTQFSPYIVFLTTLHSKSQMKLAGGNYFRHYCNVIGRIIPAERYCMYHVDQHPFLPAKSVRVWDRQVRAPTLGERTTKSLDFFM